MGGYRLYFMDRFSGHIDHRRDFIADSDAQASEIAQGWFNGDPMELWLGGRKLKHWDVALLEPSSIGIPTSRGE